MTDEVVSKARGLSLDLHPSMLDDRGLLPALHWYLKQFTPRSGIKIDFKHSGMDAGYAAEMNTVAFEDYSGGFD